MSNPMLGMALIVAIACGAQVLGSLTGIPQIVPLLAAGVIAGPSVLDLFDPDALLGSTLDPFVTLSVGVVLYDGALRLRKEDLGAGVWRPVTRLVTLGVGLSWVVICLSCHLVLGVAWGMSILIGAILTLSGPTVVAPLLRYVRPERRIGTVLEWEGILIDPIGAILAVLVFTVLVSGNGTFHAGAFLTTVLVGLGCGLVAAGLAIVLLRARRLPIPQKTTGALALVLLAVASADAIRDDAGLVSAIVVGVAVAHTENLFSADEEQRFAAFGETLVGLLIGILFVILAARVDLDAVVDLGLGGVAFVAILLLVQRPVAVAVAVATARTVLSRRERLFAAGLMPRGIVVASTASAFQISLVQAHVADADKLVPVCFLVIAATVVVYGLGARPLAARLGVAGAADEAPPP